MRARSAWSMLALCLLVATRAAAADTDVAQSKEYFRAGAAAYELGDYSAAIQALDAAYRLTPLPAIAFSLAQAERRQYFVSRERAHLERAIELFRSYLAQVATGGRRADATDALGQLEPLAVAAAPAVANEAEGASAPQKTRVMVSCEAPAASIAIDGGTASPSPVIAQVDPGPHRIAVSAPGFFPVERTLDAIAGALVPLEVALRQRPAQVLFHAEPDAELHIDGALVGKLGPDRQLQLPAGAHRFVFAKAGYRVQSIDARVPPGASQKIAVDLEQTSQRTAALVLFVASGVGLGAGAVFTGLAVDRENAAGDFLNRRAGGNVSAAELAQYDHAVEQRDRFRLVAGTSFALSAAALITGLCLYVFDQPDLTQAPAPGPQLGFSVKGVAGLRAVDARLRF